MKKRNLNTICIVSDDEVWVDLADDFQVLVDLADELDDLRLILVMLWINSFDEVVDDRDDDLRLVKTYK